MARSRQLYRNRAPSVDEDVGIPLIVKIGALTKRAGYAGEHLFNELYQFIIVKGLF